MAGSSTGCLLRWAIQIRPLLTGRLAFSSVAKVEMWNRHPKMGERQMKITETNSPRSAQVDCPLTGCQFRFMTEGIRILNDGGWKAWNRGKR
jgi:hypothetical protein